MLKNQPPEKEHKLTFEDRSKAGKTVTEKQILSQRWRRYKQRLKQGKIEHPNPKWLLERIEDDKSYAIYMLKDLDELERTGEYPLDKLIFLKNQIYKSLHGMRISGKIEHEHKGKIATINVIYPVSKEELEKLKKELE